MISFTTLENIAQVSLGYKSLQNDFFYLNEETIKSFGIERRFVQPITVFRDLDSSAYFQEPTKRVFLFVCREKLVDLRGTGALRYIHAMAGHSAAQKKQSSGNKTIREVLEAQSGGLWYAPKAKPHKACIWLRKAFNTIYSPFLFRKGVVLDQRCNYLEPVEGLSDETLATFLTSTTFAYAVEINGSASMGAGALEAPTSKLRRYPVLNLRQLSSKQESRLLHLARLVWEKETPVDWANGAAEPGKHLRELDIYILKLTGDKINLAKLYEDLHSTCRTRITVAQDKVKTAKKIKTTNIETVASSIVDTVTGSLSTRQFPENFHNAASTIRVEIPQGTSHRLVSMHFLDDAEIMLYGEDEKPLWKGTYNASVAEAIIRAVLLGRGSFEVPQSKEDAASAVKNFLDWFDDVQSHIDRAIEDSALGTGYENILRSQIFKRLGINPHIADRTLPQEINLRP